MKPDSLATMSKNCGAAVRLRGDWRTSVQGECSVWIDGVKGKCGARSGERRISTSNIQHRTLNVQMGKQIRIKMKGIPLWGELAVRPSGVNVYAVFMSFLAVRSGVRCGQQGVRKTRDAEFAERGMED